MINFIKKRRLWYSISLVIFLIGLFGMFNNYKQFNHFFNLGIDFTGGTSIILRFNEPVAELESSLRTVLNNNELEKHTIQLTGKNDVIIKTEEMTVEKRNALFNSITSNYWVSPIVNDYFLLNYLLKLERSEFTLRSWSREHEKLRHE